MLIIGHRGAPHHAPENTLGSFKKAMEMQASMIELDISLCRSGELVVIHDERVDRTTDGEGLVSRLTLKELKKLDAGGGERIPTLAEAMDLLNGKVRLNIELKGKNTAPALNRFLAEYLGGSAWRIEDLLVSSFDLVELSRFKALSPGMALGPLHGGVPLEGSEFARPLAPRSLHFNLDFIREELVAQAHRNGYQVYVFTVDHPEDRERMKALGVDGIFSNDPRAE